jgi:hypothetical protein
MKNFRIFFSKIYERNGRNWSRNSTKTDQLSDSAWRLKLADLMWEAVDGLEGGDREGDAHGNGGQGYAGQTTDRHLIKHGFY